MLSVAQPAQAASEQRRYVAHDTDFMLISAISESWHLALDGVVSFVPAHDRATITLHDVVAKGTVPVGVFTNDGRRLACVPNHHATVISGLVPGERVWLFVLDATFISPCHTGATAGTIIIKR